ncbi:MAG: response regulator transcription factor [Muribaculaceae bacterium]|nr:response regulator transcription factor [Muribaculaceae bacterium]
MNEQRRILVVDDEEAIREGLRMALELAGYDVDTASSAEEASSLDLARYDLMLLDIMMGPMSGTELASAVRADRRSAAVPIIFLTALDSDDDMVAGLSLGADDYIAKPFSLRNVLARVEAVLRRAGRQRMVADSGVRVDRAALTCLVDGREVRLPRKEFEILALLLENPGRVFTREELLLRVWPEKVVVVDRSVDVHITRLRGKIAPYGGNIVTRSGYGYGWQD